MRTLFTSFILVFLSLHSFAQDAQTSFCSKRSTNEIADLTVSEGIRKRQNHALEWFNPPEGEGYVSPERLEKGFDALEDFRRYCAERCNAYETLSMYIQIGQIYFDLRRYDNVFAAYQQAINTSVRIPIGYEKSLLLNTANIYFERGDYQLLGPCLDRLNELSTISLLNDGHLMSALQLAKGQHEQALEFINTVIKYREESATGMARSKDYRIKKQILEKMGRKVDPALIASLDNAITRETLPGIFDFAPPKMPGAVTKGKIQGTCSLEFDVLPNGKTDNVHVTECEHKILEDVSIKAIANSIYRPRIIDGTPVKTVGMRHTFSFTQRGASSL